MELGVTAPVPALQAPTFSLQSQQGFWARAQTGEKQVRGLKGSAITRGPQSGVNPEDRLLWSKHEQG